MTTNHTTETAQTTDIPQTAGTDQSVDARRSRRSPVDLLRTGGYVTIGATDAVVAHLRRLSERASEVRPDVDLRPQALTSSLRELGADVGDRVELLEGRGREVVGTLQRSAPARVASARTRVARSQVKATGTTVRRAADAGEQVVEEAVETVGTPEAVEYESMTFVELRELARERNIEGRSDMHKAELIAALREA